MTDILAELVAATRRDLATRRSSPPPIRRLQPAAHRFRAALSGPGPHFILEMKPGSPSQGLLRERYDPETIARGYDGIADAVSVVTAGHRFGGSLAHLRAARRATAVPLLCKDFIVDPVQVAEARRHGADAVLLMLSVLDDAAWRACAAAADGLGMDVLTEVHDEAELDRALALNAPILGINNRDLRTMAVDLATTARLAPRIPAGRIVVAESGIRSRADVARLAGCANAFLVGTTLMRAADPGVAARELVFGRVKVCGITSPEDARLAWEAGAVVGGLVFAAGSPRAVGEAEAARIAAGSPLPLAGVFVNEATARIAALARRLALAAVQLHGDETPDDVAALRPRLPAGCEIWKAVRVRDGIAIPRAAGTGADRILLDAWSAGTRGGTGVAFDWGRLADYPDRAHAILAGGIGPENAAAASGIGCWAIDAASGTESAPGVKDAGRMGRLFGALREAP